MRYAKKATHSCSGFETHRYLFLVVVQEGRAYAVAFSPDGEFLTVGADNNNISILETATGECKSLITGHTDYVRAVAYSQGLYYSRRVTPQTTFSHATWFFFSQTASASCPARRTANSISSTSTQASR